MAWCRAEPSVVVQAVEDEVQHPVARERIRMAQEVKGIEGPVDATDAQVSGEVIFEFVPALLQRQCQPVSR